MKGPEFIWNQFDRKVRVGINRVIREEIEVVDGGKRDLSSIEDELARRRREQGLFSMNHTQYLVDLYDAFPENMKIFLAYHGGDLVGSMITLLHKKRMRVWVGTPKTAFKGPSANDYIQWRAIEWACSHGYEYFENMDGGNDVRLTSYKSKFNPELSIWFSATKYASPAFQFGKVMARYLKKKAKNLQ
jgi:lipid II:glycine glycyltransferase (peptidoglycan interpeptide bridge formation enzyme)